MNGVLQCKYTIKSTVILFSIGNHTTNQINTMLQRFSWKAQSLIWPRSYSISRNQKFNFCIHKIPPLHSILYPFIDSVPYLCSRYFNVFVELRSVCKFSRQVEKGGGNM
jgi:hypothetical protein